MSVQTLRRRLADYGLRRYGGVASMLDVWNAAHAELRSPGNARQNCTVVIIPNSFTYSKFCMVVFE